MSIIEYAKSELERVKKDKDGIADQMDSCILEIIKKFGEQGHSGCSARYAIAKIERLLLFKPITPITGDDDEWIEVSSNGIKQNKRCSSVFQQKDGSYEDIDAIIVSDNGGITWFTSGRFRKTISFPYFPPTRPEKVYIEYTEDVPPGFTGDNYEIITERPERIKALYERKRKEFNEGEA